MGSGRPQRQAVAISLSNARRHSKRAEGGGIAPPPPSIPAPASPTPRAPTLAPLAAVKPAPEKPKSGLLHSAVPGRTDHLKVNVRSGAYVIPADVVSGVGQGNTLAGAKIIIAALEAGPDGKGLPNVAPMKRARGGQAAEDEDVPILGAGGEIVVHPAHVAAWGNGDLKRGHKVFDRWVVQTRKEIIKEMQKLPGPVKN